MNTETSITVRSIGFLVACPIILMIAGPITTTVPPETAPLIVGAITSFFTFLLTVIFVRWDRLALRDVGAGFTVQTPSRVLFGLMIGVLIVAFQEVVMYADGHMHWITVHAVHPPTGLILLMFAGYFLLALREELSFRAYPLRRLESAWGMWPALLLVSAVFTLEHTASGWTWSRSLLGPPAGAFLFGMAALASRGIAIPLGIHAAFNFGQWLMGQKEMAGIWRPIVDAGYERHVETLGYGAYLVGMLSCASIFWIWKRRSSRFDSPG